MYYVAPSRKAAGAEESVQEITTQCEYRYLDYIVV